MDSHDADQFVRRAQQAARDTAGAGAAPRTNKQRDDRPAVERCDNGEATRNRHERDDREIGHGDGGKSGRTVLADERQAESLVGGCAKTDQRHHAGSRVDLGDERNCDGGRKADAIARTDEAEHTRREDDERQPKHGQAADARL